MEKQDDSSEFQLTHGEKALNGRCAAGVVL